MGAVTEICNQATNVPSPLQGQATEEARFQGPVELATAPEQLQQALRDLQQKEDFKQLLANSELRKHNGREEYYLGQWEGGNRKGRGIIFVPGEYLYHGNVDRLPQGKGVLQLYRQNIVIEGHMHDGKPQGQCHIRDLTGLYTFQGIVNNQQLPTSGHFDVTNKEFHEKSYTIVLDEYPHNKAKISFQDGCQYIGEISFDSLLPHGQGEERYTNHTSYAGGWENGKYHGHGRFSWPDGSSYEGEYQNGLKHGTGNYVYASKKVYKGEWANGKQEGRGKLQNPQGKVLKRGIWENGAFVREDKEEEREKEREIEL